MDEDGLLSEALAPMKDSDREDYKAWVEMESDPVRLSLALYALPGGRYVLTQHSSARPTSAAC